MAADADADDVRGGVEEVFAEGDEGFVAHFLDERVDAHGVDKLLVVDGFTGLEYYYFGVCVDALDGPVGTKLGLLFWKSIRNRNPDVASTAVSWETERGIWSPVAGCLLQNDVLCDILEIGSCNALA